MKFLKQMTVDGTVVATQATAAAHAVMAGRTINATLPLRINSAASATLSADATISFGGLSAYGAANTVMGMNSAATGLEWKALAQGSYASVTIAHSANTITLDTVQDIRTTANPTWNTVTASSASSNNVTLNSNAPEYGILVRSSQAGGWARTITIANENSALFGHGWFTVYGGGNAATYVAIGLASGSATAVDVNAYSNAQYRFYPDSLSPKAAATYDLGTSTLRWRDIYGATLNLTGSATINGGTVWHSGNDGTASGLDADLIDGIQLNTLVASLRAGFNVNGGGTISVHAATFSIKWTSRLIVISNGRGTFFGTSGFFDIGPCPTTGSITGTGGHAGATATTDGIPLSTWDALYYILPIGSNNTSVTSNFILARYTADVEIPHNWLLIAVRNGDSGEFRFCNGMVIRPGESINVSNNSTLNPPYFGGQASTYYINTSGTAQTKTGNLTVAQLTSSATTGTAPLVVSSTTLVSNLNSELWNGKTIRNACASSGSSFDIGGIYWGGSNWTHTLASGKFGWTIRHGDGSGEAALAGGQIQFIMGQTASTGAGSNAEPITYFLFDKNGMMSASRFTSTVSTGTAPFVVSSTNTVSNLSSDLLDGQHGTYYTSSVNHTLPTTSFVISSSSATLSIAHALSLMGDTIAFRSATSVEYWDFVSSWLTNSDPIGTLLTGRVGLSLVTVPAARRKWRFVAPITSYIGDGYVAVHQTYDATGAHQLTVTVETGTSSSGPWTQRASQSSPSGELNYHFYVYVGTNNADTYARITVESADATNSTSYTGLQFLYSYTRNGTYGGPFSPFYWNSSRWVGLGTESPTVAFHVVTTSSQLAIFEATRSDGPVYVWLRNNNAPSNYWGLGVAQDGTCGIHRSGSGPAITFGSTSLDIQTTVGITINNSSPGLRINGTVARTYWYDTDGTADSRLWDIAVNDNYSTFRLVNDAGTVTTPWLTVTRSGTTVSSIVFSGATTISGNLYANGLEFPVSTKLEAQWTASTEYSGPSGVLGLIESVASGLAVQDAFRYSIILSPERWNGSAWSADTVDYSPLVSADNSNSAVVNFITAAEQATYTKKRFVVDTGGQYTRPNFFMLTRYWNGSDYPFYITIETSTNNSTWTTWINNAYSSSSFAYFVRDQADARYFRITIEKATTISTGALSFMRLRGLTQVGSKAVITQTARGELVIKDINAGGAASQITLSGNSTAGRQIRFGDTASIQSGVGTRYASGATYMSANATQSTYATDMWTQPYNNASYGSVIMLLDSNLSSNALTLMKSPSAQSNAAFSTFFGTVLMSVTQGGNLTAGQIFTTGSTAGLVITRRDTSVSAWQWYSQAGNLTLYDHAAGVNRMDMLTGGNVTFSSSATSGIVFTVAGGASQTAHIGYVSLGHQSTSYPIVGYGFRTDATNWLYNANDYAAGWEVGPSGGITSKHANTGTPGGTITWTSRLAIPRTGSVTIDGNAVWHVGNDGSGSGLDADYLDGQDSAYYLNTSSTGQTKTGTLTLNTGTTVPIVLTTSSSAPWAITILRSDLGTNINLYNGGGYWYFDTPVNTTYLTSRVATGTAPIGVTSTTVCTNLNADLLDGQHGTYYATATHVHGNITNAGAIGSTSGLPVITTTSGVLTTGSFGSGAGTFCQGNDSRLSDARTPTAHASSHAPGGSDALPWTTIHGKGNTAGRPAAASTNAGYLYANTSTNTLQRSTGAAWEDIATLGAGGGGTVTTVSVVSANGFAGTVANASTTPAITLTTTITGVLKGNGTAISAAVAGTDYVSTGAAAGTNGLVMGTSRLLGRGTAGGGNIEEMALTGAGGISFSWAASSLTVTMTSTPTFSSATISGALTTSNLGTDVASGSSINAILIREVTTNRVLGASSSLIRGWIDAAQSSHTHGNITAAGAIGSTSDQVVITTTGGVLTTQSKTSLSAGTGLTFSSGSGVNAVLTTGTIEIATNGVGNAQIRQSAGCSVVGRSASTTGDVADITAGADGTYLTRSGGALTWAAISVAYSNVGSVTTSTLLGRTTAGTGAAELITVSSPLTLSGLALGVTRANLTAGTGLTFSSGSGTNAVFVAGTLGISTNGVGNAQFRQSSALSVVGRSANSTGDVADITAGTNRHVLQRSTTPALTFAYPIDVQSVTGQTVSATSSVVTGYKIYFQSSGGSIDIAVTDLGSGVILVDLDQLGS